MDSITNQLLLWIKKQEVWGIKLSWKQEALSYSKKKKCSSPPDTNKISMDAAAVAFFFNRNWMAFSNWKNNKKWHWRLFLVFSLLVPTGFDKDLVSRGGSDCWLMLPLYQYEALSLAYIQWPWLKCWSDWMWCTESLRYHPPSFCLPFPNPSSEFFTRWIRD